MSFNELKNAMRLEALAVVGQKAFQKIGIVTGYNPNTYSAKVNIQPENTETGYLPILSQWVGNQWGAFSPPSTGDIVIVNFLEGNYENGFIILGNYNNQFQPLSVSSGEYWLVHQSGSYLKLTNDGNIVIFANEDLNITINSSNHGAVNITGNVNITGDTTITGKLTVTSDITSTGGNVSDHLDSMEDIRSTYNIHVHGVSPTPTPTLPT